MTTDELNNHSTHDRIIKPLTLIIIWGLILEFPVRYFLSPDPWIHSADHWYFKQPARVLIELGFVLAALFPFFVVKALKPLLSVNRTKNNLLFLSLGVTGSILIFTVQQWEEIQAIQLGNLSQYVPVWFITGLLIGIGQEITFRGLIYTGVDKKYGTKAAIIISTLCFVFGSVHSARMYTYFINGYIIETFLLLAIFALSGLFFVWLRIKTKNIIIPAVVHGIGNAITWATFVVVELHAAT